MDNLMTPTAQERAEQVLLDWAEKVNIPPSEMWNKGLLVQLIAIALTAHAEAAAKEAERRTWKAAERIHEKTGCPECTDDDKCLMIDEFRRRASRPGAGGMNPLCVCDTNYFC